MTAPAPRTSLPTRRLGRSELEVSVVGLGCNNFGRRIGLEATAAVLDAALDAGITFFDTADIYGEGGGSERLMGEALEGRRDAFLIATKFGMEMPGVDGVPDAPRGSRDYIRWAVEGSLKRLRMDRIDLYQYHQPDGTTPIAETLAALGELIEEGLVTAIGCSNVSAAQIEEAERAAREAGLPRFETVQNEYNLLERGIEAEVVPACERLGISILPYFPLARGLLTGKYRRGEPGPEGSRLSSDGPAGSDEQFDVVEALEGFAAKRGVGLLDVAIAGLAAQPAVGSVIAGATRSEQVAANVAALRWEPSPADLEELDRIAPDGAMTSRSAPAGTPSAAMEATLGLLRPGAAPQRPTARSGYLDLLAGRDVIGPHPGQRLMGSRVLPLIYERVWRPIGGRLLLGLIGPDTAEEHRLALEMLDISPGERVLDVGCGPGNFTRDFARATGDAGLAVGIDASETMLAAAVREGGPANLAYVRGDACALPFADQTFDAVCCFAALYLIEEPMAAIDEIVRVLAPGGRVALLASCARGPLDAGPTRSVARALTGIRIFGRDELTSALSERSLSGVNGRLAGLGQFVSAQKPVTINLSRSKEEKQ